MSYSVFESLEASESEHRIAANAAAQQLDVAIEAVKVRHAAYLNQADSQRDFFSRLANVRGDMRNILLAHGMEPRHSTMNKVIKECKNEARPHWLRRQAAEGTSVADAAPVDVTAPVGTLTDNPVGAVTARRTAKSTDDYHTYNDRSRTDEDRERDNRGYSDVGNGMVQDWETGDTYPDPRRKKSNSVPGYGTQPGLGSTETTNTAAPEQSDQLVARRLSFRDFLAGDDKGGFNGPLIPEGNFDAYLREVTGPETDEAASEPFEADSEDRWENTGKTGSLFEAALRQAEALPGQGMARDFKPKSFMPKRKAPHKPRGPVPGDTSDYNFTGSPETQYHHRQDVDWSGISDLQSPDSIEQMYEKARRGEPIHAHRRAALDYALFCKDHRLAYSRGSVAAYGQRVPVSTYADLLGGIRTAWDAKVQRVASGKDHLQTSQDAITKMLNELAEEFQKSIVPLQDALQSVQFAQQSMAAQQSPMNVMPPGTVNVMPGQDPAAGGAPPMDGQNMAAAPGPGGMSPMVDPNATGGAPADPAAAGGGAPAPGGGAPGGGGLPPEIMQVIQQVPPELLMEVAAMGLQQQAMGGGGGAPAGPPPGGGGGAPAQRPVANLRRLVAESGFPFGGGGDSEKKDDDKPKDDEKKSEDGDSEKSESKSEDKPKDSGDGPPKSEGGDKPPAPSAEGGGEGAPAGSPAELDDAISTVLQLLELGKIDVAQSIANELQITDEDINSFLADDPYESGDPFAEDAGGPPPEAAGPPAPPAGPPVEEELPGPPPELVQASAERYLRWASKYNLPITAETAEMFRHADFQQEFARDIADGTPDTAQQARFVNYLNRWQDMRANEQGLYNPNPALVSAARGRRPFA